MKIKFDFESRLKLLAISFIKKNFSYLWELRTPKNITYMWGFGRFLGIVMVVQILSGVLLAFFYVSGEGAWESVILLTREVRRGWLIRLVHANMASFVFVVLFIHFFRAIIQRSFYLKAPWVRGWTIIVLTIMAAFLGYVLPWGQMSFWGATVIINLLSVLPIGKTLVIWLWGGFYVSSFTCRFFFALHFLVPFLVLLMAGVHLFVLHFSGRSLPGGLRRFTGAMIKFSFLFLYKDIINIIIMWAIFLTILVLPDWSADPVNFVVSDLSNSPIHIQPEWYFLHLYAVLRSIPNKVGGLIGFALALVGLLALAIMGSIFSISQLFYFNYLSWSFLRINLVLLWLGIQPVEAPYIFIGQTITYFYFSFILIIILLDGLNTITF